jgi:hypothetical protein
VSGRDRAAGTPPAATAVPDRRWWLSAWVAPLLLAVVLATQYGHALRVPFINDDFVFLDKTGTASFTSLWEPRALAFHWYRPVSRELPYWALPRLFGLRPEPFHVLAFGLWLGCLATWFALVRHWLGVRAAAIATAGMATLAAWAVPLVWAAAAQELWMLLLALLSLYALARGSTWLATAAFAAALLSKETAAALPAIALAHERILARRPAVAALRRVAPMLALVAVWAALHPMLGGRLRHPPAPVEAGVAVSAVAPELARTLLVPLGLDRWPRPERGWAAALATGLPAALALGLLVLWGARAGRGARGGPSASAIDPRRAAWFGGCWALAGWAPLLLPGLGWHAYYALLGSFGVWLALAVALARMPLAATFLVAALALVRAAQANTPSRDWGTEWYQKRAGAFLEAMRADLMGKHPKLPAHARLYFVLVPSNVGFLAGDGPALRVWYRDSTLRAGFYPSYRPRPPGATRGEDYFFRFDSTAGWVRVQRGPEDLAAARRSNPRWQRDHEVLAQTLATAGDWGAAAGEYVKLALAEPARVDYAFNVGVCHEASGDSAAAAAWFARAAALPGADDEVRVAARRLARHL